MDALIESSQGDMRVMLGQLQMHRLRATSLSFDDVKGAAAKDMDKSPFECARVLLSSESARMRLSDRMDCVFQDADLIPLLIQARAVSFLPMLPSSDLNVPDVPGFARRCIAEPSNSRLGCGGRSTPGDQRASRRDRPTGELHQPPAERGDGRDDADAGACQSRGRVQPGRRDQQARAHERRVEPDAERCARRHRVPRLICPVRARPT